MRSLRRSGGPPSGAASTGAASTGAATTGPAVASLSLDISVRRRQLRVGAAFEVGPGQRLSIFGTSGAGKSTILESICGLVRGVEGRITFGDHRLGTIEAARQARIALVRQPTSLFPHLSVIDNICYGPGGRALGRSSTGARRLVGGYRRGSEDALSELLEELSLTDLAAARPLDLSGGQRQRVALARALYRPFSLLLLDEPLSAVDGPSRTHLRETVERIVEQQKASAVLVSHDLAEAQAFGHRLAVMDEGELVQIGEPSEVAKAPSDERVAELCGYVAFLDAAPGFEAPPGRSAAVHPERVLLGAYPELGPVLSCAVRASRARGPRFAVEARPIEARLRPAAGSPTRSEGAEPASPGPAQAAKRGNGGLSARAGTDPALQVMVDTPLEAGTDIQLTIVSPPLVASVARRGAQGRKLLCPKHDGNPTTASASLGSPVASRRETLPEPPG